MSAGRRFAVLRSTHQNLCAASTVSNTTTRESAGFSAPVSVTAQAQNRQRHSSKAAQLSDKAASCVCCVHDSKAAYCFLTRQTQAHRVL